MKILVLANRKGGVGKTTLAAHLAVAAEHTGSGRCALIDTDPQASLAEWWNSRAAETPAFAPVNLQELTVHLAALSQAGFAYAVIDTPPAITEVIQLVVAQADLVLIPIRPSPHDLRAVGSTVGLVQDAKRPFAFTVTQAKARTRLVGQAQLALAAHGLLAPILIQDRVDYAASMIDGRTVLETDPRGRSAAEICALWSFVKARIAESTK